MADSIFIGNSGDLWWQKDYVEEEQSDHSWTARATALCKWDMRTSLMPALNSLPGPSGAPYSTTMYLNRRQLSRESNGTGLFAKYLLFYGGIGSSDLNALPESYGEFIASQSEAPIQTHPSFKTFAGTPSAPVNNSIWNPDDGTFIKFGEYLADGTTLNTNWAGVQSYLSSSVIWRWHAFSFVSDYSMSALDTRTASISGVTVPSGRNWLLVSKSCIQQGYIFHTTFDYLLSGPNGWNTSLYS